MKTFKTILLCFLLVLLAGCGSRKIEKIDEKKKEIIVEASKVDEAKTEKSKTNIFENCDEVIIEPISPTDPMIFSGKIYKNVRFKRTNKKVVTNILNDTKERKTTTKRAKKSASSELIKKDLKRESGFWRWWLWFLLIIPVCYLYRKYKHLIWFV